MDSQNYQLLESQVSMLGVMESEGLKFKKAGNSAKCLCPFHTENTPSFSVKLDGSGVWSCFSCGESGKGAIAFIRKYKGLNFKEACEYLGIKLDGQNREKTNKSWSVPPLKYSFEEQEQRKLERAIRENKERLLSLKNGVDLPKISDIKTNDYIAEIPKYTDRNSTELPLNEVFKKISKKREFGYQIKSEILGKYRHQVVTGVKEKWPNGEGNNPKFKWTYYERSRNLSKDGLTLKTGYDRQYSDLSKLNISTSETPLYLINNTPDNYPSELNYIFLTEGEKDSAILYQLLELAATTFPIRLGIEKSASKLKKLREEFHQLELVIIFTDNDDAGLKHAKERFLACYEAGLACVVINPITGKLVINFDDQDLDQNLLKADISDQIEKLINQGLSKEDIRQEVITMVEQAVNNYNLEKPLKHETKQNF